MKIHILGCSGGLGPGRKTTSFLVDEVLLVDAGSGLEQLNMEQMLRIRHVLITHAHIDHILGLPLMLGTIYERHNEPLKVYAIPEVLDALRCHIFNWVVWPDFTCLPKERPILELYPVELDSRLKLGRYEVAALPAIHPTPAVGFWVGSSDGRSFAFTGDSGFHLPFWQRMNKYRPELIIADISFTAGSADLAADSGHMTVDQLAAVLPVLEYSPEIRATHFKVGQEQVLTRLLSQPCQSGALHEIKVRPLCQGELIDLGEFASRPPPP